MTVGELAGPNKQYQAYAARQLADLAQAVTRIQADLRRGDIASGEGRLAHRAAGLGARRRLLRQLRHTSAWRSTGCRTASPVESTTRTSPGCTGSSTACGTAQSAATLLPVAATLASNVAVVQHNLTSDDLAGDPTNLPVRAHEILEDALRDHLSGIDDQGGGAAFAQTYADLQVTGAVLGYLAPLINSRQPGLPAIADSELSILQQALLATRVNGQWESLAAASPAAREHVDAAIDAVLETLAAVPDLLEVPPAH